MKLFVVSLLALSLIQLTIAQDLEAMKKKFDEFQKKAKEMKSITEEFREVTNGGGAFLVNKKGGDVKVIRKGKVLSVTVKDIVEKDENETIVRDVNMRKLKSNCAVEKDNSDDNTYSLKAVRISLKCTLPNDTVATLDIFMFKEAGNITSSDDNEYEVLKGAVKINLEVKNWPGEAKKIEVTFAMKCGLDALKALGKKPKKLLKKLGRKANGKVGRNPQSFSVCPEARGTFAANYKSGENPMEMPGEYPKAVDGLPDNAAEIVLSFKNKNFTYDPVMEVGEDIEEGNDDDETKSSAMVSLSSICLTTATFLFARLF